MVHGVSLSCAAMDTYSERLISAMQAASVDVRHLARHLGVVPNAIKKAIDGKTAALSAPNNSKAARFLGVDSDWLATGEGYRVSAEDWPFKKVTLAQLRELEATSPGAIEHIETTALGLLSLAKTPILKPMKHHDTGAEGAPDYVLLSGKLPPKESTRGRPNTHTERGSTQRKKRL
jgi:hypothetical protein